MKLTRRQLVMAAAGSAMAVGSVNAVKAQSTAASAPAAGEPADNVRRNGETLEAFPISIFIEPAFRFKA